MGGRVTVYTTVETIYKYTSLLNVDVFHIIGGQMLPHPIPRGPRGRLVLASICIVYCVLDVSPYCWSEWGVVKAQGFI